MNSSGASNIAVLKKNPEGPAPAAPKKAGDEKKARGKEIKVFIRKLDIESGRIDARIAVVGDKAETLTLRRIELTNIGKPGGDTPAQVTQQVLSTLVEEVGRAVAQSGIRRPIEKGVDRAGKRPLNK